MLQTYALKLLCAIIYHITQLYRTLRHVFEVLCGAKSRSASAQMSVAAIEQEILTTAGIADYFVLSDVKIGHLRSTVHTLAPKAPSPDKKNLVLLHGYLATSVVWYRLLDASVGDLVHRFNVYAIDLPGMGFSRVEGSLRATLAGGARACTNFFIDQIDEWRAVMRLEKFCLLGHSFGGYLAAQYALAHAHRVERLLLLSPAGVTRISRESNALYKQNLFAAQRGWDKYRTRLMDAFWRHKVTPSQGFQHTLFWDRAIVESLLRAKFKFADKHKAVHDLWVRLYLAMLEMRASRGTGADDDAERTVHEMFFFPRVCAVEPLEADLRQYVQERHADSAFAPTLIAYGDSDWMNREGATRLCKEHAALFQLKVLAGAGHQMHLDNPAGVVEIVK